ncbi:P-loop NTPase [Halorubrum sp. DTA98]|uniref:P-loop NTPase n=1 Tax=Halorubrum sp. DTA98 TaxID=3402163 RepID=UPI003AACD968
MSDAPSSPAADRCLDDPTITNGTGPPTLDDIRARLKTVEDPILGDDVVSLGLVDDVRVDDDLIVVRMGLYAPYAPSERRIVERVNEALCGSERTVITVAGNRDRTWEAGERIAGVRNVVPFVSTHARTEPSTVATNVAFALSRAGARVGVLELDDYVPGTNRSSGRGDGASGDRGGSDRATRDRGRGHRDRDGTETPATMPATVRGVRLASSRHLLASGAGRRSDAPSTDPDASIDRLLTDIDWSGSDYLFVDVTTERSDLRRALFDRVSTAGAVVTTTRSASIATVRACFDRLEERGVTPFGLIESVNGSVRGALRRRFDLTPSRWVADESDVPVLGTLPEDPALTADHGTAVVGEDDRFAAVFDAVAANVADAVGASERRAHSRRNGRFEAGLGCQCR